MTNTTLEQLQALVEQLSQSERLQFLAYLSDRIAQIETNSSQPVSVSINDEAWQNFFRLGDEIAALDTREGTTLTATLVSIRR